MKKIYLKENEIFLTEGLELEDLKEEIKEEVIQGHSNFLYEIEYNNLTRAEVIEDIKLNGYLFDNKGNLLPLTYYTKTENHKTIITKTTINLFGNEKEVIIKEC